MANENYAKARRLGLKEVNQCHQRNVSPYLPALDNQVEHLNALGRVKLGIISIPIDKIVGTATSGRASAFAANFMPVLSINSEFATKWEHLYESVLENGVCTAVVALEYLNRFYLLEGNKRVSVSKYLDAAGIEAEVTRVLPPSDLDTEEVRLYRELLPFINESGVRSIWFSREGSAAELYELIDRRQGEKWTAEEAADFNAAYYYFRRAYKRVMDKQLEMTTGDAFLIYLRVFGYQGSWERTGDEMNEQVSQLYSEFLRAEEQRGVELIMEPSAQTQSSGIFSALFGPSNAKVAFLYNKEPANSGWMYWHDLGRMRMEQELEGRVETTYRVCTEPALYEETIEALIEDGNRMIFTTAPTMLSACVRPSLRHPEVKILNCSLLASYHNVRSYYLRTYEAKMLLGMIAGVAADNNKIGYIADYPIYGIPASINAFALGARMVNPRAKVYLKWSACADYDPENPFDDPEICVVSNLDVSAPSQSCAKHGLYRLTENGPENLAMPILNWGKMYTALVRSLLNGKWGADLSGARALDYWWGMSAGVIDLAVTQRLDPAQRRLVDILHEDIREGSIRPFEGPLRDQTGALRCAQEESLSPAQILTMDYLLENVIGSIPELEQLRPEARALVELQGLREKGGPDEADFSWSEETKGEG